MYKMNINVDNVYKNVQKRAVAIIKTCSDSVVKIDIGNNRVPD